MAEHVAEVIQEMPPRFVAGEFAKGGSAEVVGRSARARGHQRQVGIGAAGAGGYGREDVVRGVDVVLKVILGKTVQRVHLDGFDVRDLGTGFGEAFQRIEGRQRRTDVEQGVAAATRGRVGKDGMCAVGFPILGNGRQGRCRGTGQDGGSGAGILSQRLQPVMESDVLARGGGGRPHDRMFGVRHGPSPLAGLHRFVLALEPALQAPVTLRSLFVALFLLLFAA